MPPKKDTKNQPKAPKVAEDKTFGMKNKKGAQTQKHIERMNLNTKTSGNPTEKRKAAEKAQAEKDKAASLAAQKEAMELFKPVQVQKVPFGVDPKTVVCMFYKKGHCEKGKRCKFSHDMAIERKAEKKDMYQDSREEEEQKKKEETMDDWDEEKLQKVVLSKKGNQRSTTEKVCKFFIGAIEEGKYGWLWTCPNGGDKCMYQHKLPPGFVLKTKEQRASEKAMMDKSPLKTLTLEEFLESERHKLTGTLTPVTHETFARWKAQRIDKKMAESQALAKKEATGRAMFEKGEWKDEEESEDEDDDEAWNLERLREETERIKEEKEAQRLGYSNAESGAQANGVSADTGGGAVEDGPVVDGTAEDGAGSPPAAAP